MHCRIILSCSAGKGKKACPYYTIRRTKAQKPRLNRRERRYSDISGFVRRGADFTKQNARVGGHLRVS
jgi:hypothetical protein